jgi:hypothetical protein
MGDSLLDRIQKLDGYMMTNLLQFQGRNQDELRMAVC